MKIYELIRQLTEHDMNAEVFICKDVAGDKFSGVDNCFGGDGENTLLLYPETIPEFDYDSLMSRGE